jgi:hypothetical protein
LNCLVVVRRYSPPVDGLTFRSGPGNIATEKLREAYTELILLHNDARTEHAGTWLQMNSRLSKAVDKLRNRRNWRKRKISSEVLGCVARVYFIATIILDIKATKIVKLALAGKGIKWTHVGVQIADMLFGTLFPTMYLRAWELIEG